MTTAIVGERWSEAELATLKAHYSTSSRAQLLALLPGRSPAAIKDKAKRLALRKTAEGMAACNRDNYRGKDRWGAEEEALLRRLWESAPIEQVYAAFVPRRGKRAVARKADAMRLRRPRVEVIRQRKLAGHKAGDAMRARKEEKARVKEQQEDKSLQLQRVFSSARGCAPLNLTMVMANPLEAAWRGLA